MTDLILVRHGETVWHAENRYAGSSDIALTGRGRQQAERLADWAERAQLDALWVSPLRRARDTAAPVAHATGLSPRIDERLVELDFGQAEGLTKAEMNRRFPGARKAFEEDPVGHPLPAGEDPNHAVVRAIACLTEIVREHPDGRALVVWHVTLKRLLLCRLLGIPLRHYRNRFPAVRNCAITTVRWNGTGLAALLEYNAPIASGAIAAGKEFKA